jgi:NAD(P)-dependent dehydrogenase (short-subunit alcohol dehydrogenase family)
MSPSSEIVIITGVGGGIGRALAVGFTQNGSKVVGLGRHETNLHETAQLCPAGGMDPIVGDVASEPDVDRLFDYTLERYGKVDVLINNAAIYPRVLLLEMSPREWSNVIEINLLGTVLCCRRALASMMGRRYGRVINVGSFAGQAPIPGASAYSVSKAALNCLTKAVAAEIDRNIYPDILVNELVPGGVRTSMSATGDDPKEVYPHARFLVDLPPGGPTGRIFIKSELFHEDYGIRARIRRKIAKIRGEKWR